MSTKVFRLIITAFLSMLFLSLSTSQLDIAMALSSIQTTITEPDDNLKIPPYFARIIKQFEGIAECPYQKQMVENIEAVPDDGTTIVTTSENPSLEDIDWTIVFQSVCYFVDWKPILFTSVRRLLGNLPQIILPQWTD